MPDEDETQGGTFTPRGSLTVVRSCHKALAHSRPRLAQNRCSDRASSSLEPRPHSPLDRRDVFVRRADFVWFFRVWARGGGTSEAAEDRLRADRLLYAVQQSRRHGGSVEEGAPVPFSVSCRTGFERLRGL